MKKSSIALASLMAAVSSAVIVPAAYAEDHGTTAECAGCAGCHGEEGCHGCAGH